MLRKRALLMVMIAVAVTPVLSMGDEPLAQSAGATPAAAPLVGPVGDYYPLTTCIVTGAKLVPGERVSFEYQGRDLKAANEAAKQTFLADPATYLAKLDAEIIRTQHDAYPLDKCPMMNVAVTALGKPVDVVIDNQLVRTCCPTCATMAHKDPGKWLPKADAMVAEQQRVSYPMTTCPVSGHALGDMGPAKEIVEQGTLIRLCCEGCLHEVHADPASYVAMVREARAKAIAGDAPTATPSGS